MLERCSLNTFQALGELQERDKALLELRRDYNRITAELKQAADRLKSLRSDCEVARQTQTAAEIQLRRLELDRATENQALATTRDELSSGSFTASYRDVTRMEEREAELLNRIDNINDRISPVLETANDARSKLQALQARLSEAETEWEAKKESGTAEQARLSEEHNEALKHRRAAAELIPANQLADYTRLFKANGGAAVATVEREVCSGCSEHLSTGELNVLRQATEPTLCHCGRYLITLAAR